MTREEAIALLNEQYETCKRIYDCSADQRKSYPNVPQFMEALGMALTALRPVSREQVERIWFREPYSRLETRQGDDGSIVYSAVNTCMACGHETPIGNFCHNCGAAQTRDAVEMVMERLEALKDGKDRSI